MIDGGLRKMFREKIPEFMWTSIETGGTGRGVPDAEYCSPEGVSGWIEFKQTKGSAIKIAPEQIAWHARRARMGGRSYVIVRRWALQGPRRASRDELWLLPGRSASKMFAGLQPLLADPECLVWVGGPARWDWGNLKKVLTSPCQLPQEY